MKLDEKSATKLRVISVPKTQINRTKGRAAKAKSQCRISAHDQLTIAHMLPSFPKSHGQI